MNLRRGYSLAAILAAAGFGLAGATAASAQTTPACDAASIQAAAPADTQIDSAQRLEKPVAHCRIEGHITTNNPGPNRVNFRLQLPDRDLWKGRYYFIGMGGSGGYVPTESQIPPGNPLVKGFAVAGTDTGRQGHLLDWTFLKDPVKALDHTHRAAHVTAVSTQQITRAYYGEARLYRYHSGCSGGGRMGGEAMMMHPGDYDGVLLGQSRVGRIEGGIGMSKFIHATQQMTREPGSWLSPAKLKMVEEKVTAACDETDGAKDGVIWDHRLCRYDVAALRCEANDGPACLTDPEIKSIKAILDGPRGPKGQLLAEPMPISNISSWSQFLGAVPPPWKPDATVENMAKSAAGYVIANSHANVLFGDGYDVLRDFDLKNQQHIDAWRAAADKIGFDRAPDLSPFEKTGGKAILWVGVSDPCCSSVGMEDYVRGLGETLTPKRVAKFIQLYEIPGMAHCGGGTGPQDGADRLLDELVAWVEKNEVPNGVVMHRGADRVQMAFSGPGFPAESGVTIPAPTGGSRDFLVCPYPLVSVFNKAKANIPNAVNDAANWSCRPTRG